MVRVIFLQNIEDYKLGDVKEVPDGYARNFLFKRGYAKPATESEIKALETEISKLKKEEEKKVREAQELADKITAKTITITEEVNDEGHLYGSVSNREIADALEAAGFEIDPANIEIEEPIKELGEYEITVKVGHGVETVTKVKIERKK